MPEVTVGEAVIPYRVRRSGRARRLRLVVTPGRVEVVAPLRLPESRVRAFVDSRRHWLRDKTRALRDRVLEPLPQRFVDGARVLFHGRPLDLRVEAAEIRRASLRHDGALRVRVPRRLGDDERQERTRTLVVSWLRERARAEAREVVGRYAPRLGARPAALRIGSQKTLWGSCSPRDVISLNWRLMAAPEAIFEYVVVHELCHLRERNHGARFWRLVEGLMPDYRDRRAWLKRHGIGLG